MPSGTVHSGCADLNQATARSVIVLVSRIQTRCTEDSNHMTNGKGNFGRIDRNDRSQSTTSNLSSNIPVGSNRNGPFHLMYPEPKLPEFWVEWKAPRVFCVKGGPIRLV